jgi:cell division protein FtsW (lipid II flippase)
VLLNLDNWARGKAEKGHDDIFSIIGSLASLRGCLFLAFYYFLLVFRISKN